jgi:hypothetical protein
MSLYILRRCLCFSLIRCLGFMVVLAYLCAVAKEFKCNQWEGKGINTDI